MKVCFHEDFYPSYTSDPAAETGRMESVVKALKGHVEFIACEPAREKDILAVHTPAHVESVKSMGLYRIAALAAGGALQAARTGLSEPCFALIRPPGHHASSDSAWGFCFFNNMAAALVHLKNDGAIQTAHVLDFDLHYGDGNVNILGHLDWATLHNPEARDRISYLEDVKAELKTCQADIIGISAGFDHHEKDWGGLLKTEDYQQMGQMVRSAAQRIGGGFFAILEGGYNHQVLGENALALIRGMEGQAI